jgi:putative redox protein
MVRIDVRYEGELHCTAVHAPSGMRFPTDAPLDNQGKGESFSPTDLVGTALGTCVLTLMGIAARREGFDIPGASATVEKTMRASPRRIARLEVRVRVPHELDERARGLLEVAARGCPVTASLHPEIVLDLAYEWGAAARDAGAARA